MYEIKSDKNIIVMCFFEIRVYFTFSEYSNNIDIRGVLFHLLANEERREI